MKVVLTADIKGVGKRGELLEVAEGYYRNFLVPKQLAVPPNDPKAKQIAAALQSVEAGKQAEVNRIKKIAAELDGRQVTLSAKARGETLFGAIHEAAVASALGIEKKLIKMEPIKTIGEHKVVVELPHQQRATIVVVVTPA